MSNTMSPVPNDHPLKLAWEQFRSTEEFSNSRQWASKDEHLDGSLWAAFVAGWYRAGGEPANGYAEKPSNPFILLRKLVRRNAIVGSQIQFVERWLVANDPGYIKPRQA